MGALPENQRARVGSHCPRHRSYFETRGHGVPTLFPCCCALLRQRHPTRRHQMPPYLRPCFALRVDRKVDARDERNGHAGRLHCVSYTVCHRAKRRCRNGGRKKSSKVWCFDFAVLRPQALPCKFIEQLFSETTSELGLKLICWRLSINSINRVSPQCGSASGAKLLANLGPCLTIEFMISGWACS